MSDKIYQDVTDQIVAQLEAGTTPWLKPWKSSAKGNGSTAMPRNVISRNDYSGVNVLLLWSFAMAKGYDQNDFLTYKQAAELGGNVKKGEKGARIIFMGTAKSKKELDAKGNPKSYTFMKQYTVFNTAQCENLPERLTVAPTPISEPEGIANVERFFSHIPSDIRHGGDKAFFTTGGDYIGMPHKIDFTSMSDYYGTLLHEHGHWTGHEKRLARTFGKRFGDKAYATEELVAEMTSAFLCAKLGIPGKLQHANYIQSWISAMKADNRVIVAAASGASKAANFLAEYADLEDEKIAA